MLDHANIDRLIRSNDVFRAISDEAQRAQSKAYLIGGYIRDGLLGLTPKDADFMFEKDGCALKVGEMLASKYGSTLVRFQKHMTVYRITIDSNQYDMADLEGRTIEEDQLRRDFTVNSLAIELTSVFADTDKPIQVLDMSSGIDDLNNKLIRVNSDDVIKDDPLRIIRMFRFENQLNFSIDLHTYTIIPRYVNGLRDISGERVRDELFHILKSREAYGTLLKMQKSGVLGLLFPLIDSLKGVTQNEYHHLDVFAHTFETVKQLESVLRLENILVSPFCDVLKPMLNEEIVQNRPRYALMKLAMLFHDIGKPLSRRVRKDGKVTFIGHDKMGSNLIVPYLSYLHLSRREQSYITCLIEGHLHPGFLDADNPNLNRSIFRFFDKYGDWGVDIVIISIADRLSAQGTKVDDEVNAKHDKIVSVLLDAYFNRNKVLVRPPVYITGDDLMRELNIPAGKRVGILLKLILEAQANGEITSRENALEYAKRFKDKYSE